MQGVEHWKKFYAESNKYIKVGRVSHPPIDPSSPIPEHCTPKRAEQELKEEKEKRAKAAKKAGSDHKEL